MREDTFFYADKPTWKVKWGKETITQPSAFDILQVIGEASWVPMDRKFPKRGIAYRLFMQFRIIVDDELPDELFLAKLAEFGIIELTVTGKRPADLFQEAVDFAESWHEQGRVT
jgi:hypothetical protein